MDFCAWSASYSLGSCDLYRTVVTLGPLNTISLHTASTSVTFGLSESEVIITVGVAAIIEVGVAAIGIFIKVKAQKQEQFRG